MHNYRDGLYILIHMTDNNNFDPKIFLLTRIFPTVSDVSIYNSPSAPLSTVAVLRIQPSVETIRLTSICCRDFNSWRL